VGILRTPTLSPPFLPLSVILQFSTRQVRFCPHTLVRIICLSIHTIIQGLPLALCQILLVAMLILAMLILAMPILMRVPMAVFGLAIYHSYHHACWPRMARKYFEVFQILIVGRANAGETTVLQRVCATTEQPEIFDGNGKRVCYGLATSLGTLLISDIQINMDVVEGSIEVRIESITGYTCWHFPARRAYHWEWVDIQQQLGLYFSWFLWIEAGSVEEFNKMKTSCKTGRLHHTWRNGSMPFGKCILSFLEVIVHKNCHLIQVLHPCNWL